MMMVVDIYNRKTKAFLGTATVHDSASEAEISDEVMRVMIQSGNAATCKDFAWENYKSRWDGK